jgi:hypothetical protein
MKQFLLIMIVCSFFLIEGCTDSDLILPIYTDQTEDNFYKNTDQLEMALSGVYYEQRRIWSDLNLYYRTVMEIPTDNAIKGGYDDGDHIEVLQLELFNLEASNAAAAQLYAICMRIITSANMLIKNAERTEGDTSLINRMVLEAKFIRAFAYFNLATYYGGMAKILEPLKSPGDYLNYPRLTQNETFEFILEDLEAATNLPKKSEYAPEDMGRATQGAAYALMAKIYLFQKDYSNAKIALDNIVSSHEYSLHPSFGFNFSSMHDNGVESVYEVQYRSYGSSWDRSTGLSVIWFLSRKNEGGYGFCCPTVDLHKSFNTDDPRIGYTFIETGDKFVGDDYFQDNSSVTGYHDRKIFVPRHDPARPVSASETDIAKNFTYIRYADVILMLAEVLNELQALSIEGKNANYYLNMVRERARNTPPKDPAREVQKTIPSTTPASLPDVVVVDKVLLRNAILKERRLELALEGWRRYDLMRTGKYGSVMRAYSTTYNTNKGKFFRDDRDYLLPIHTSEIDKSHGVWENNPNF